MFQLKFYIILLVVTVLGPINTFSAPVTKLDDGAVESETTTVENFSINFNNSTNNKLDEISSSTNIFISSSTSSSSISSNSELIDKDASTVISTDSYFISGLSDLLLENQDFDRVDEIETELENSSNRLTTLNRDDVTEVPTKIIAVSEVPLVLSTAKIMTKITKKQKSRIKPQTPTTTIPPELYITDLNESPETKMSPITVNATDNNIIDTTANVPHPTTDDDFTTIKIIDNNLEISAPTIVAIITSSSTTSMPVISTVAKKLKNKKQLRKKYGQKKIDNVDEDNDDDGNQQVDFPTTPFPSTTISATDVESLHRSPIIVEQIEYETRNGTTATANVILNNKTEILEVEIFDQRLINVTNKELKLSDDLVKVITSDDDLPSGSNFDVLEMGGLDMGMVPAQSSGNSSEYPLRTTLEKSDEFIYADVDDDTLKIHHKINTEKFPSTEMINNKIFGDLLPSQIDRDSDTIFYISNTEVKVVESMPTPDSTKHGDGERMIPEIYEEDLIIDLNNQNDNNSRTNLNTVEKYSEDIILSPLKNNFDPIKNFNDENLSISYVGESFIDIEESTNTPSPSISTSQSTSDVIIQPVIIPDIPISIGVPVIGELPPQLDLRNDHIMDDIHGRLTNDEHVITMKSQVLEHPGDNLFKNPLSADLREDTIDKKRTEAALSNRKNNATTSSNGTHDVVTNGTLPFGEENDDHESGFSDIQTLFLACILTLAPLILSVIVAFGVR